MIVIRDSRKEAVVIVIERDSRILMIERAEDIPGGGYWAPPSGRIESGETQTETVVRETKEEVGLTVEPLQHVWECPTWDGKYWLHWWLAKYIDGDLVLDPAEVSQARWMTVDNIFLLDKTFEDDLKFFREIFPKYRFK